MEQLIAKWAEIQASSLDALETTHLRRDLADFSDKFESCLDEMYRISRAKSNPIDERLASFEKELQLKQHLAILLTRESPIPSQTEMNIALWKAQPYIHSLLQ